MPGSYAIPSAAAEGKVDLYGRLGDLEQKVEQLTKSRADLEQEVEALKKTIASQHSTLTGKEA